jgi:hypothetical protein
MLEKTIGGLGNTVVKAGTIFAAAGTVALPLL